MKYYAGKENGIFIIYHKESVDKWIEEQPANCKFDCEIKKYSNKRSLPTLGYFFGGILPIIRERLKELGYQFSPDETYNFVIDQMKCLKTEIIHPDTSELLGEKVLTASKWSQQLANEVIEELNQYCAEKLDLVLPEPLKQFKIDV